MHRSISYVALWCGLLALAAASGGCQRGPTWDLAPVEGTVTKDGRPLADIQVTFWADVEAGTQGPRTSAYTDAAGHYELRTDTGGRGATTGRYRVCLLAPLLAPGKNDGRGRRTKLLKDKMVKLPASDAVQLPPAYSSFEKTPLRAEVHPGSQVIDLEVK